MLGNHLAFGDEHDPAGVDAQTDGPVGERRRHAVAVALEVHEACRRDAFGVFNETIERLAHRHQVWPLLPTMHPIVVSCSGCALLPQRTHVGQPVVERRERTERRHLLPEPTARILDVLLDLPLLPAGGDLQNSASNR